MDEITSLIFAGVGGQGVLLIAEITALAAVRAGYDVKQTEVHGVSQRGGSVESHVRFGPAVHSPLVMAGQADGVIGLEKLEGLRFAGFLRPAGERAAPERPTTSAPETLSGAGGLLLVNDHEIIPASVANAAEKYPHHALKFLRDNGVRVMALPASLIAKGLGDGRMANVVLLGALSALLSLPEAAWRAVLDERIPARHHDATLRAFAAGQELAAAPA